MALEDLFGDFGANTDWDAAFGGAASQPSYDYASNIGDFGSTPSYTPPSGGYSGGADVLSGSYYAGTPATLDTPTAAPTATATAAPGGGGSLMSGITSFFGLDPNSDTGKLVNSLLPLLAGGGAAAAASLFGANAGKQAAAGINRDTQRIVAPTAQEQSVMDLGLSNLQRTSQADKSPAGVYGELSTTLGPMIEELLSKENEKRKMLIENLIGNRMATGGVLPQQNAYLAGDTNRAISEMIAKMVAGERQLRANQATQTQNVVGTQFGNEQQRRQQGLLEGQKLATGVAEKAGTAPANAMTQAALLAQLLGAQQPNYRA